MSELILHHFKSSPFAEKIRLVLGFKRLTWRGVEVPVMLPKPEVVALTGGYRRTPFLQIGADIYCDTALICRVLDELAPDPALYPVQATGIQHVVAQWADSSLFWAAVPYAAQPAGIPYIVDDPNPEFLQAFAADRAAMTAGMRRPTITDAAAQLGSYYSWLESLLTSGRPFLLGDVPCIADFAVAHSTWFVMRVPPLAGILAPYGKLTAWYERMRGFGHGPTSTLPATEAIEIASRASYHAPTQVAAGLGFEPGAQVTVSATDYAADLIAGTLVGLTSNEVVIERRDERAGLVHVHFPRINYQIKKAK